MKERFLIFGRGLDELCSATFAAKGLDFHSRSKKKVKKTVLFLIHSDIFLFSKQIIFLPDLNY